MANNLPKISGNIIFLLCILVTMFSCPESSSSVVGLNQGNVDTILNGNQVVFVNFYADCSDDISTKYHITKYPTLKLFRNGRIAKREYRAQRSKEAFVKFVQDQMADPIVKWAKPSDIDNIDEKKRSVIGYFNGPDNNFQNFVKVANILRDDCTFYAGVGDNFRSELTSGPSIMFRPPKTKERDMLYLGPLTNFDLLVTWSNDKCMPLVREITFENGEELTEEGIPFLILFHDPSDTEIVQKYNDIVARELVPERGKNIFQQLLSTYIYNPLSHLGKSSRDLPVLAIDSFRHMYLFKDIKQMNVPGKLRQFIKDLHSGKLHREFHHGPDPTEKQQTEKQTDSPTANKVEKRDVPDTPPESTFVKLKPSTQRYSMARDEL
ncbi:endoplasmic reticulum resident protein 44-like [Anneissia japonica]|uniref:endoplasmic reticulum resident protein 44-like n=1 Tax=Anneissia japonica TaxID=1529436 RepID=UPI001425B354|nr:endoplasmic reticulum resident protein 44-like [Anneissia japonica]